MKQQFEIINNWYSNLPLRDRNLLLFVSSVLAVTLFYLIVWEPVNLELDKQQQNFKSQQETYTWMQTASSEAKSLKRSAPRKISSKQPIALILENSANNSGLKQSINKIESAGKNGARVKIDSVSFDQLLVWLNTLEQTYGVIITTANIERGEKTGTVSARLSLEKPQ